MYQALNSISRPKSASQKKKPTLVYTDYFKHIHKMELGKKNTLLVGALYILYLDLQIY